MNHKRGLIFIALTVALVFAFAASAYAIAYPATGTIGPVRAMTFNWMVDYYTWGTPVGGGVFDTVATTPRIQDIGANPANPGVHAGYLANTAKCGICHSVHRARGDGVKLLNTQIATCIGCHNIGSPVTHVQINWRDGPHGAGVVGNCALRPCHITNPHGAGSSTWTVVAAALLNPATDALFTTALAHPVSSTVTTANLDWLPVGRTWTTSTASLVRTGYNCNLCHTSTMLAVVGSWTVDLDGPGPLTPETRWWAEDRRTNIVDPTLRSKTGHPGLGSTAATAAARIGTGPLAWAPVTDCESCHDQRDLTRTGFTFPHGQTIVATSNLPPGRSLLWMGWAAEFGAPLSRITTITEKAFDGNCLKCHRDTVAGVPRGVGFSY